MEQLGVSPILTPDYLGLGLRLPLVGAHGEFHHNPVTNPNPNPIHWLWLGGEILWECRANGCQACGIHIIFILFVYS